LLRPRRRSKHAATAGKDVALSGFAVGENRQWQEGSAQADAAIDRLDEQLRRWGKPKGADVAAN
jgi:hypothetical protein